MSSWDRMDLRSRFLAILTQAPPDADAPQLLCAAVLAVLPVQRVAITVSSDGSTREFLSASDEVAERLEFAQITLGEGPGVTAGTVGPAVLYDAAGTDTPWPLFAREAELAGIGAVLALPLQLGTIRVGVLSLYLDSARDTRAADIDAAITVADLVTVVLLSAGSTTTIDPLDPWWDQPESVREIHQATGMIVAQLNVPAREAYVRLRAYAFANGLRLGDAARAVVHERLRIDPDPKSVS